MRSPRPFMLTLSLAMALLGSCAPAPSAPGEDGSEPICAASDRQDCVCVNGRVGSQECSEDGSRWLACACGGAATCRAGETVVCTCDDGRNGERTCSDDGLDWSACLCQGGSSGASCETAEDCQQGEACREGQCVPRNGGGGGNQGLLPVKATLTVRATIAVQRLVAALRHSATATAVSRLVSRMRIARVADDSSSFA